MKKSILLFLLTVVLASCSQKADPSKLPLINGYWQISKVTDEDGNKKEYPINEVYDYFDIKNNSGFHKKVQWQPDGTFLVNDLQEEVKVMVTADEIRLDFSSTYGKHSENLTSLSADEMVLVSKDQLRFVYKKVDVKPK
ncbi:lipocalin family protein [Flavobacterium humi]|uniref:Type IV secretion system putative lipoprotein virB7 n=1 Tax=Flavobacterium humi TaxID=2562683 RepID=A0A4Z0LAH7_9FLAO|nr:lipocalin family protein [Flavobacterium humi]TGD58058.1 hypothetical protein E4635_08600 [Flavobacterium humi]